ncbi:hypothetical protein Q5752_002606 [Cryptotrichosporon argae]
MAIFKKKASKDRELGVRSPSNSPPVGTAPTMTPLVGPQGRDASGSYGPPPGAVNGRRLTSNPMQPPPNVRPPMGGQPGRESPAPGRGYAVDHSGASGVPPSMQSMQAAQTHPPSNPSYPWSTRPLRLFQPSGSPPGTAPLSPFPRWGLAVPNFPSHSGHMLLFGGLVQDELRNDLWSLDVRDCSVQLVKTKGDAPSPRVGHASAIADRIMLVWGGDSRTPGGETTTDDRLYILDLRTQEWTVVPLPPGPQGRYGHAVCMNETTFYVFGGQTDDEFFDDLWAFDIRQLASDQPRWERVKYATPPPSGRTSHTIIPNNGKLYVQGGTDGKHHLNDTWSFDIATGVWDSLQCIGYLPTPRERHAVAIVDDTIYMFGGRDVLGKDLGDLAAFRISNQRWYMFQNMGPSPNAKSGHALCAANGKVFVLGGDGMYSARDDPGIIHVLDTTKIKYPADSGAPPRPMPRPRTTSDAAERPPFASGTDQQSGESPQLAQARQMPSSASHDSLQRAMSPQNQMAQQAREPLNAPPSLSGAVETHRRTESLDQAGRPNGVPPQRPRREGDEEYRRTMSPANGGPGSPGQPQSSPGRAGGAGGAPGSPQHASHTIHPNLRNTRSPPPLRVGDGLERPALPPDAFYFGGKSPTANGFGSRPGSMVGGRPGSFVGGRPGSFSGRPGSVSGMADVLRELKAREAEADAAKRREAAFRVLLSRAIEQGFVVNDAEAEDLPTGDMFANNDALRQLAEALVRMKHEKAAIQDELVTHMRTASDKIAEAERLQRGTLQEAAFYRAKAAAIESGSTADLSRAEGERVAELERELEVIINEHATTRKELNRVTEVAARDGALHTAAAQREAETLKRAEDAEDAHARALDETDAHRQRADTAEAALREHGERLISLTSLVQQREAEKSHLESQLEAATSARDEHVGLIEQAQASIASAGVRAIELQEVHGRAEARIAQLEDELADVRAELESRTREADKATSKLAEVEDAHAKTRDEADNLRSVAAGRLGELVDAHRSARADEERAARAHADQLRALEEEKASLMRLLREAGQRVDAAEQGVVAHRAKVRDLEDAHQTIRGEMRTHRTKLLGAQTEVARYRDLYAAKDAELKDRDVAIGELETRLGLLRKLLTDHGIAINDSDLSEADVPDSHELELALRDKARALENAQREADELTRRCAEAEDKVESLGRLVERIKDARSPSAASMRSPSPTGAADSGRRAVEAERRLQEAEQHHKEKMAALESDYQTAVRYVKGTEKMLKRMKDELNKQKATNGTLQIELDTLRGRPVGEAGARTRDASGRSTPSEADLARRLQTAQAQQTSLQAELQASRDVLAAREREADVLRMRVDDAEREVEALRDELAQAQHRINTLLEMGSGGYGVGSDGDGDHGAASQHGSPRAGGVSDDEASMAFDKFTNELKQWERARSPDADAAHHDETEDEDDAARVGAATGHQRHSSEYSGDWAQ